MLFDKSSFNFGVIVYNEDYKWLEPRKLVFKNSQHERDLVDDWHQQYDEFTNEKDHVKFFLGGNITNDELFVVDDFDLPRYLQHINQLTILEENSINRGDIRPGIFKAIIGATRDNTNSDLMLFQIFESGRQLMKSDISYAFDTDERSFEQVDDKVISFRTSLTAVYKKTSRRLLFRSYKYTNSILKLKDHFQPSDEKEIREVVSHPLFQPEDVDTIVSDMSYYSTVRIALINRSSILDNLNAIQVRDAAEEIKEEYRRNNPGQELPEINLTNNESKVIFPINKTKMSVLPSEIRATP